MHGQLRADGSLRHLITLEDLPRPLLERLLGIDVDRLSPEAGHA